MTIEANLSFVATPGDEVPSMADMPTDGQLVVMVPWDAKLGKTDDDLRVEYLWKNLIIRFLKMFPDLPISPDGSLSESEWAMLLPLIRIVRET